MSDTSYEQNIANRLRDRLDGTILDRWGAEVIDSLLAENAKLKAQLDGHLIEQPKKSSSVGGAKCGPKQES